MTVAQNELEDRIRVERINLKIDGKKYEAIILKDGPNKNLFGIVQTGKRKWSLAMLKDNKLLAKPGPCILRCNFNSEVKAVQFLDMISPVAAMYFQFSTSDGPNTHAERTEFDRVFDLVDAAEFYVINRWTSERR